MTRRPRRCRRVERERGAGSERTGPPPKRCVGDGRESGQDGPCARSKPLKAELPAARHQSLVTCIRERADRPLETSGGDGRFEGGLDIRCTHAGGSPTAQDRCRPRERRLCQALAESGGLSFMR